MERQKLEPRTTSKTRKEKRSTGKSQTSDTTINTQESTSNMYNNENKCESKRRYNTEHSSSI